MIYIDYFSTVNIVNGIAKFTGGTNYANNVISEMLKKNLEELKLIVPFDIKEDELPLLLQGKITLIKTKSIKDVDYSEARLLYLPQVNGTVLKQVKCIKNKYPHISIYGTLHDRQHNCFKFDRYNLYYYGSISEKIKLMAEFYCKKIVFDFFYQNWISYFDKVFTVSNYSLQHLINKKVKYINYFIQDDYTSKNINGNVTTDIDGNFCLMVGAGRPEKNALRTIEAFCEFHRKNPNSNLKMVLTGITENKLQLLTKSGKLDTKVISENVIIKGYVSYFELNALYTQAKYVVFTSKAEGFGLPALEAVKRGKAVLASFETSIPEVLGSTAYYVNPYEVDSIEKGFEVFENHDFLVALSSMIKRKWEILDLQIELDKEALLSEIFS